MQWACSGLSFEVMATRKHRGGGDAVSNDDPTRLFNTPISDEELTLGIGELTESRTMAVAPEDNEALLNELLSAPISSPIGDGPLTLPGAQAPKVAHPADREQSTVAIAQLDAPTIAFKAQSQEREKARADYQKMLTTMPLTVQRNPGAEVPVKTAIMALPKAPAALSPQGTGPQGAPQPMFPPSHPPPAHGTGAHPVVPQAPYSQGPVAPPASSHAMMRAPQSGPQSSVIPMSAAAQAAPIPHIVPGAQKMPAVVVDKKKSGGGSGLLIAFLVLAVLGGGGFYGYRTHRFTLPTGGLSAQAPAVPAATQVAAQPSAVAAVPAIAIPASPAVTDDKTAASPGAPAASQAAAAAPPDPIAAVATQAAPASTPAVAPPAPAAAAAAPASTSRRRASDAPTTPVAAAPVARADEPKVADSKPAAESKPAKPGKGAKPAADAPAAAPPTSAEEEEMKKATETLTNSL